MRQNSTVDKMKKLKFRSPEQAEKAKQSLVQSRKTELEIVLRDSTWILQVENIVMEPAKSVTTPTNLSIHLVLNTDTILCAQKLQRMQRLPSRPIANLDSACICKVVCGSERRYYLEITGNSSSNKVCFYPEFVSLSTPPTEILT